MMKHSALLALADGTVLEGFSVGASGDSVAELVFNTSMTGYQEMLTDPSYAGQIITLTTAHVGNTGCNSEDMESFKAWACGLVMRNCCLKPSNYRSEISLPDWLKAEGVIAISGIDTRQLTIRLREQGALAACISTNMDKDRAIKLAQSYKGMKGLDLAKEVSRKQSENWNEGRGSWAYKTRPLKYRVVAYDFGIKHTILRILQDLGCEIRIVPAETSADTVLAMKPDGVLLANGPGDPAVCDYAINATKRFLEESIPLLGICLGFQILALACGAKSNKMKFGHHGSNHPVAEVSSKKQVYISSQNHGFAIDESSLPDCLEVSHRSLFDQSLQGIRHTTKPAYGFQGHPEGSPGPHDVEVIFEPFISAMQKA